ncbi:hypothetical protein KR054_000056 [Drosophila jambulina]|nr:hypothetical protein KR054_000056 [Drosophila jambulina]
MNIIKTSLDLWLQRHHRDVAAKCLIIVAVTMFIQIQMKLISWWVQLMQTPEPHFVFLLMAVVVPFLIGYKQILRYFTLQWLYLLFEKLFRIMFADFIVRRLLYQLQLAGRRLPHPKPEIDLTDPATRQIFQQVQIEAYRAVQLFRRDANAILDRQAPVPLTDYCYMVLEDEIEVLWKAGCNNMLVNERLLRKLLSPYGEDPKSSE